MRRITLLAFGLLTACGGGTPQGDAVLAGSAREAAAVATRAPPVDLPALSAGVIGELAADVPELGAQREALEAREREAVQHVLADLRGKLPAVAALQRRHTIPAAIAHVVPAREGRRSGSGGLIATAVAGESELTWSELRSAAVGKTFGELAGALDGIKIQAGQEAMRANYPGKSGNDAALVVKGEEGGRATIALDTKIDMTLFLVEANSRVSLTTASLCPDVNGKVEFKIALSSGGHAGSGRNVAFDHTREANVVALVNDQAEIDTADVATNYGDRSTRDGKQAYTEGATTWRLKNGSSSEATAIDHRLVRASSQATAEHTAAMKDGLLESLILGESALKAARDYWQGGACIKILAESPGRVERNATSSIPVTVTHRQERNEIAAKVTADLAGGKSVDPAVIPRTPGTLTHVAPDEKKATMEIRLTATSRRGKATETLKLSISEELYRAEGGADEFHGEGVICDIAQPFTISGSGVVVKFAPASPQAGTYTYSGSMSGFPVFGDGKYSVDYQDERPVGIRASGVGSVKTPMGVMSNGGDERYTLTPATTGKCE
jgi:hypothetical protein